ncbi:MAG: Hachiman antiphage defense system protein HamA [Vulcanimicrobiaceae bacterium]|jgi:hypothetical protein
MGARNPAAPARAFVPALGSVELGEPFYPDQLSESRDVTREHVHVLEHELRTEQRTKFAAQMADIVRDGIIDPDTIRRLGDDRGAIALRARVPRPGNVRLGDFGEIVASEFVRVALGAAVSYRLRGKVNVNMAMHGVDCIGVRLVNGRPIFYKGESKVRTRLGGDALRKALSALEADDGLIRAEDLVLLIDEQRRAGNVELEQAVADELVTHARHLTRHVIFTIYASATKNGVADFIVTLRNENRTYLTTLKIGELSTFIDDVYAMLVNR